MEFDLSFEQRTLIQTVRGFIAAELHPLEHEVEDKGHLAPERVKQIQRKSFDLGLYAMNVPERYGGGGLSTLDWMLVEEQFGRTTDILVRRAFGNIYDMLFEGTPEQVERWLLPSVRGERVFSIAFSEPEAGSDAAGIKTMAKRSGTGWTLNGSKHFISDGDYSDFFIITAVTNPEAKHHGISAFIVDKDTPGLTVGKNQEMMGLRGTGHVELFFNSIRLGPESLLGKEGKGLQLALTTLGRVRLAQICARAIGKASLILERATDYANQRMQFGKPIAQFQMIQQMLADSAIEINSARLALLHTAWEADRGLDVRARISMVKVQASEMLGRVADRAVQIFGGMGYCKQFPIERYYRDARVYRLFDGTSEIHRAVVARALAKGLPLFDIPSLA